MQNISIINNVGYSQGQLPAFKLFCICICILRYSMQFTLRHCGNAFLRRGNKPMHGHAEHRNTAQNLLEPRTTK